MAKNKNIKIRETTIHIELRENVNIRWNKDEKSIELINSEGQISKKNLVSIGESYARSGKSPKILRQVPNRLGGVIKSGPESIHFDRYIGIDTSYEKWGQNLICSTACLTIEQKIDHINGLSKGETLKGTCYPRLVFLCKPGTNPERYGWKKYIESFANGKDFNPEFTYGIIVDSELGLLPKINAGEEPVFENYFLPDNLLLIYASADTGENYFYNKLIRATDRVAASALKKAQLYFSGQESMSYEKTCQDLIGFADDVDIKW